MKFLSTSLVEICFIRLMDSRYGGKRQGLSLVLGVIAQMNGSRKYKETLSILWESQKP
ncbi:MAG: hypothetical protein Q8N39_09005 [Pelolinea sp.]|nr:hypothetical protein [Pelolinea sp.]